MITYNAAYNPNRTRFLFKEYTALKETTDNRIIFNDGSASFPQSTLNAGKDWYNYFQAARSKSICGGSVYDVEYRIRFPKNDANSCCFYMNGINHASAVFAVRETGIYFEAFTNEKGYNYGNHHTNADKSLFVTLLADGNLNNLYTWNTVRLRTSATSYEVYFNDKFIISIPRDPDWPLTDASYQGISFQGTDFKLDWIKIKKDNTVAYFEDFNDPYTPAQVAASALCSPGPDCQANFTNYFNQRHNTSYSFGQLSSIYEQLCGKELRVCGPSYKDSLKTLVDSFYVNAKPGRVKHNYAGYKNLSDLVHDGIIYLPDSIRQQPSNWYNNYQFDFIAFCTNKGFTIESRFKFLDLAHYGDVFYLGYRSIQPVFYLKQNNAGGTSPGLYITGIEINNYNYGGYPAEVIRTNILVDTSITAILRWMTIKAVVKPDKYELYYNGKLVFEKARDPKIPIANQENFSLGLYGRYGTIDYIRIADVNDNVKYFEDFNTSNRPATVDPSFICKSVPGDCQLAFKNYYNTKQGTNYSYNQIDSVYKKAGLPLDACKAGTGTGAFSPFIVR